MNFDKRFFRNLAYAIALISAGLVTHQVTLTVTGAQAMVEAFDVDPRKVLND